MSKKNFKLGERVFVDGSGVIGLVGDACGGSEGVVTHEANRMGHVKVRLDNVPTPIEQLHDEQDGLWCLPEHMFYVKRTSNVGDEVFVARNGVIGCNQYHWMGSKGNVTSETMTSETMPDKNVVRVKLNRVPHGFSEVHDNMNGLWCEADEVYAVEREKPKNEVPSPCEIRMSFVGNATTMSLVDTDGKVRCSATARCHPNDEFSVAEGMGIAFERLYQKYRKQNPDHSAIMVGDKVRVIKGAALPLVTSYGNTDKPCEIVLNEVGTVTSLSPNSANAIVEWRERVVAAVATASLEIVKEPKAKPKYQEGDILVTKKSGYYVRLTKDYYEWEEKVHFETPNGVCGKLTPDRFVGKLDDNERVDVGDVVEIQGVRYRGMVVKAAPRKNATWVRDVLVLYIAYGNTPRKKLIREDFVKPLHQREPFVGETVFALNASVTSDYGLNWYDEETIANEGRFCVVKGWHTNPMTGRRRVVVGHADGSASINPKYILLLD